MLDECGSNIDAAIKRLELLRLSGNTAPEAAQDPTAAESEAGVLDCWVGPLSSDRPPSGPHLCAEGTRRMPSCCGKQFFGAALLNWSRCSAACLIVKMPNPFGFDTRLCRDGELLCAPTQLQLQLICLLA